jgi:hypothetical protein
MLKGKKTYVTGILGLLGAVGFYFTGDLTLADAVQTGITSLLGMTIRAGVTTEARK